MSKNLFEDGGDDPTQLQERQIPSDCTRYLNLHLVHFFVLWIHRWPNVIQRLYSMEAETADFVVSLFLLILLNQFYFY